MKSLRKIMLAGTILLGSLAYKADAQEFYRMHFQGFNQEIAEELDDPSCPESANLVVKVQEGYKLEEFEQREVRSFFQNRAESYIADKFIERLEKSGLRKYVEPVEKVIKGIEIKIPRTKEGIRIKPDVDFGSGGKLQGGVDFSYRNLGASVRSDGVRAGTSFFRDDNKRLSVEAGYDGGLFLGLRFGIIY